MKKIFGYLVLLASITSCGVTDEVVVSVPDNNSGDAAIVVAPPPRVVSAKTGGYVYTADRSDSSEVIISYDFYTPQFSSNLMDSIFKDSVNKIIHEVVWMETFGEDESPADFVLTRSFFEGRKQNFIREAQEEVDYLESMPWSLEMDLSIDEDAALDYVELDVNSWSYTGGAHGNGYSSYFLIDKKSGRELGVEDFFSDLDKLNAVAESYFRTMEELPEDMSLEEAGYYFQDGIFSVNNNFFFTDKSVVFYFNTYEIGPYAGGPTELEVPLTELASILIERN